MNTSQKTSAILIGALALGGASAVLVRWDRPTAPAPAPSRNAIPLRPDASAPDAAPADAAVPIDTAVPSDTSVLPARAIRMPRPTGVPSQRDEAQRRRAAEAEVRRHHANTAAEQQRRVRAESRQRPEDPHLQSLVASAMRNAVASGDRLRIASLRQDITWLAGMPTPFRNPEAVADAATVLPEWIAAHDDDTRPSERWIQWATQNLR